MWQKPKSSDGGIKQGLGKTESFPSQKNVDQSRFFFGCRHTIITPLSASLITTQFLINIKGISETESGWRGSLCAVSCLMFGYMNWDNSYTSNIWDEERRQGRGGGGGAGGGGELPFPKGLKGWMCAMYVWEQSNRTQGSLNLCQATKEEMHHRPSISDIRENCVLSHIQQKHSGCVVLQQQRTCLADLWHFVSCSQNNPTLLAVLVQLKYKRHCVLTEHFAAVLKCKLSHECEC